MSFSATCHLSGLIIKEDETVVCLPVSYSTVKHTTQLVYAQNNECNAIGLPLIGKYNGYGSVQNIDKQSVSYLLFQDLISSYSIDNDKKSKKFPIMQFCAFKDEYNRAAHGEFINDDEIKNRLQEPNFYPLADIEVEAFLDLCHSRAIFDVSSNSVNRIGFILIKKSIFDKICKSYVSNKLKNHKKTILSFCEEKSKYANSKIDLSKLSNEDFAKAYEKEEISTDFLHQNILAMFNGSNSLTNITKSFLISYWENSDFNNKALTESLLHSAQLNFLYSVLGKSLYPNINRNSDCSAIASLCNVIQEEISGFYEQNKTELLESGYCETEDAEMFEESRFKDW